MTTLSNRKIVLIDDNELDNFISRKIIEQFNHGEDITDFLSATEALKFLIRVSDKPELIPEIIFLDISMPFMSGFAFLNEFEKLPQQIRTKTKVVMLSSSINETDIEKANSNPYVIKFINKPLSSQTFKASVLLA